MSSGRSGSGLSSRAEELLNEVIEEYLADVMLQSAVKRISETVVQLVTNQWRSSAWGLATNIALKKRYESCSTAVLVA